MSRFERQKLKGRLRGADTVHGGTASNTSAGLVRVDARERAIAAFEKSWADVHIFVSPEFVVEWVSPSVSYVTGWTPADMIGSNYEDFLHRDDAEEGNRMAIEMLSHPDGFDPGLGPPSDPSLIAPAYERLLTADGRYLPMESRGNVHLSDSAIGGIHFVLRDVTDLQMQDRLLTLIAEDAPLPAIITAMLVTVTAQVPGVAASLVLPFAEDRDTPTGADHHERTMLTVADEVMDTRVERHVVLGDGEPWGAAAVLPLTSPDGEREFTVLSGDLDSAMDAHRMAERSVGMSTTDLPTDVHRLIGRADVHMYATKAMRRAARRADADQRDGVAPSSISS